MSQVINHKLHMISTLVEFSSISRVELLSESDKVSLLRISLHDMKVQRRDGDGTKPRLQITMLYYLHVC